MKENQLEMMKKKKRILIRNHQKMTKSKSQTLIKQFEFFLISNTVWQIVKLLHNLSQPSHSISVQVAPPIQYVISKFDEI